MSRCPHEARLAQYWGDGTGRGVRVAVIDSGLDPRVWYAGGLQTVGFTLTQRDTDIECALGARDELGHGTSAGLAVHTVAPNAVVVPIRVFQRRLEASPAVVARAVHLALEEGCRIINVSMTGPLGPEALPLAEACVHAAVAGAVIVAARPVIADGRRWLPADLHEVLSVTCAPFSCPHQYARQTAAANQADFVTASGNGGVVVGLGGRLRREQRPSFAAPILSGLAACILERYPTYDVTWVRRALERGALAQPDDRASAPCGVH